MGHHVRIALLPFPCFLMAQVKNGGKADFGGRLLRLGCARLPLATCRLPLAAGKRRSSDERWVS